MGWSLSWAALKGGNLQTACAAGGLRATGKREETAESRFVGAQLPTADVDYVYDAPAELAKELTGFRHDQDTPGWIGEVFEILERESVLGKLLGRFRRRSASAA